MHHHRLPRAFVRHPARRRDRSSHAGRGVRALPSFRVETRASSVDGRRGYAPMFNARVLGGSVARIVFDADLTSYNPQNWTRALWVLDVVRRTERPKSSDFGDRRGGSGWIDRDIGAVDAVRGSRRRRSR